MADLARPLEVPVVERKHTVWLRPSDGEDWGKLSDAVYQHRSFSPNLLCVLVAEVDGRFRAFWSQAREEYEYPNPGLPEHPYTRCDGTRAFDDFGIDGRPDWWREAERRAEKIVREACRD